MNYLLFPLGNAGQKFEQTRHNAGRFVYEKLKSFLDKNLQAEIEVFLPSCFMNESGKYLKEKIKNTNFKLENLIVLYDDKDLPLGEIRLAFDRGDGGHNGLKSIIQEIGSKNFWRIRLGIAPFGTGKGDLIPPHGPLVEKYVLARMTEDEEKILESESYLKRVSNFLEKVTLDPARVRKYDRHS